MRIVRIPLYILSISILSLMALAAVSVAIIDRTHLHGVYQVWQENQTFVAACIALVAAMFGARPVYMQVRAQAVQAALDLLHRTESEAEALIAARRTLFEVRRTALALAGEIIEYTVAPAPVLADLKQACESFMALSPRQLRMLSERPTINEADKIKIATLSYVVAIAQRGVADLLAHEQDGAMSPALVAKESEFITSKIAGLFSLSSEIAEDLDRQEGAMRVRAQHLRDQAEAL